MLRIICLCVLVAFGVNVAEAKPPSEVQAEETSIVGRCDEDLCEACDSCESSEEACEKLCGRCPADEICEERCQKPCREVCIKPCCDPPREAPCVNSCGSHGCECSCQRANPTQTVSDAITNRFETDRGNHCPTERCSSVDGSMTSELDLTHSGYLSARQQGESGMAPKEITQSTPVYVKDTKETSGGTAKNTNKVKTKSVVQASALDSCRANNIVQDDRVRVDKTFKKCQYEVQNEEDIESEALILAAAMNGQQNNVCQDARQKYRTTFECDGPVKVDNKQNHRCTGTIVTPLMDATAGDIKQKIGIDSEVNCDKVADTPEAIAEQRRGRTTTRVINPIMSKDCEAIGMSGCVWDPKFFGISMKC